MARAFQANAFQRTAFQVGAFADLTDIRILIAGVDRTLNIRFHSITITDVLNEAPNTATMTVVGITPIRGQDIKIELGVAGSFLFAGTIQTVDQVYESTEENVAHSVSCVDYTWLLNGRMVSKKYPSQSATTTVIDLMTFTSGFTTTFVEAGLPTVAEFVCTDEDITGALTRLATLIGGYWYVDYTRALHFFLTEATDLPLPLDSSHTSQRQIVKTTDVSQVRNRIRVEGHGAAVLAPSVAGDTSIPVEDVSGYSASGGIVKAGPQRLTYTGKSAGGSTVATTITGNVAGPVAAPSRALGGGAGHVQGNVQYKVAFANASGETAPGPASTVLNAPVFASPDALLPSAGGMGKLVGVYNYKVGFVTALGETVPGTVASRTAVAVAAPGACIVSVGSAIGKLIGAFNYKVTFVTALGETAGGTLASRTAVALVAPFAPSASLADDGPLIGTYNYKIGVVSAIGETIGSAMGFPISPAAQAITLTPGWTNGTGGTYKWVVTAVSEFGETAPSPPTSALVITLQNISRPTDFPANATRWRVYRTISGGGIYRLAADLPVATTSFADTVADADLGQTAPAVGTMGRRVSVATIPTGPTGTLARRVYRTKAGGSTYFLVAEIPDNSTTTYNDVILDAALTVSPPLQNLNGDQHALTSIPTGPTGTTARRLYRTKAGGSTYYPLIELPDNASTTFTDNTDDAQLGSLIIPAVSTAGGERHDLIGIPTGPTGTLARRLYRTVAGGAEYRFLAELGDNVTTTFTDNVGDSSLGGYAPLVNTAGASTVSLTTIPTGGAGITQRVLYRTEAGGSVFKYLATINDNATTVYTDDIADANLGRVALTLSTLGAVAGDTNVLVASAVNFPAAGWFRADSQTIKYTGISGNTLTGIPASGAGAITGAIKGGLSIVGLPFLLGIPAAGAGSILYPIAAGDILTVIVEVEDTAAQATLAALLGIASGVREHFIQDRRWSIATCTSVATAELALFKDPETRITYQSRDPLTRSGKVIAVNLGAPTNIVGSFKIQTVTITEVGIGRNLYPLRTVTASTSKFSFEDLLRRLQVAA